MRSLWLPVPVLAALGLSTAAVSAAPPARLEGTLGEVADPGFAQALMPRPFTFPLDHAAHPEFRQEWWYFTGHLDAPEGQRFGFELTFFRFALAPPQADPAASPQPSAWRTRQIYMAHFAVTDIAGHRFEFEQKLSRAALCLAGADRSPLKVWIDDWALEEQGAQGTAARWHLRAAQPGYELQLDLAAQGAPVPNGNAGLSVKSSAAGAASYYYSIPRIAVTGTLRRAGQPLAVSGLAWFDHEWGSAPLSTQQSGWDWFALQLDDGTSLMFYALRDRTGARDPHSAGTWIDSAAGNRSLGADAVAIEAAGSWTSRDGVRYPATWRIRVPALALDVTAQPVLADQELRTTPRYWEGAVDVKGTRAGKLVGGGGYVELVGYSQERCPAGATGAHGCLAR